MPSSTVPNSGAPSVSTPYVTALLPADYRSMVASCRRAGDFRPASAHSRREMFARKASHARYAGMLSPCKCSACSPVCGCASGSSSESVLGPAAQPDATPEMPMPCCACTETKAISVFSSGRRRLPGHAVQRRWTRGTGSAGWTPEPRKPLVPGLCCSWAGRTARWRVPRSPPPHVSGR